MNQKGFSAIAGVVIGLVILAAVILAGYLILSSKQAPIGTQPPAETKPTPVPVQQSPKVIQNSQTRRGDTGFLPLVPKVFKKLSSFYFLDFLKEAKAQVGDNAAEKYLVYHTNLGTPGQNPNAQIFLYLFSSKETKQVTSGGYNANPIFSPDGTKILFYGGKPVLVRKLQLMNLADSSVQTIADEFLVTSASAFSPDGSKVAYEPRPTAKVESVGLLSVPKVLAQEALQATVEVVDLATFSRHSYKIPLSASSVAGRSGQSAVSDIVWSADGQSLFVNLENGESFPRNYNTIVKVDLNSGSYSIIEDSLYEKRSLALAPDQKNLSYFRSSRVADQLAGTGKTFFVLFDIQENREVKNFLVFDSAAFLAWPYLWKSDQSAVYISSTEGLRRLNLPSGQTNSLKKGDFIFLVGWGLSENELIIGNVPELGKGGLFSLDLTTGGEQKVIDVTSE